MKQYALKGCYRIIWYINCYYFSTRLNPICILMNFSWSSFHVHWCRFYFWDAVMRKSHKQANCLTLINVWLSKQMYIFISTRLIHDIISGVHMLIYQSLSVWVADPPLEELCRVGQSVPWDRRVQPLKGFRSITGPQYHHLMCRYRMLKAADQ